MRASRFILARFGRDDKSASFADRCMQLKNRFRGRGQYNTAQVEASNFLKDNIFPNLDSWLTLSSACAAISVMSFFEIDHPQKAEISAWIFSRLSSFSPEERIEAGQALLQADIAKYRDSVRGSVITPIITGSIGVLSAGQLSILCKMMQRCGNDIPANLWDPVAKAAQRRLAGSSQFGEVVRFFSAFSRAIPNSPVTQSLCSTLLANLPQLKAFDYATVVQACSKLHQSAPLKLSDFRTLAMQASEYGNLNCRDIGTILSNIMRMRASYKATPENVSELWAVDNTIQIVLHTLNRTSIKFMDPNDERAWSSETDIVALVFAFESSGGMYKELFKAFDGYVRSQVSKMEGRNLALSLGILRRTGMLDDDLAKRFSERIEAVMDDFIINELSHVVFTYVAARGENPPWIDRARTRMSSLLVPDTPPYARLNIRVSFPGESALVSSVDLSEISFRQLADVMGATSVDKELREEVNVAFKKSLETIIAPNCAEVEVILNVAKNNLFGYGDIARQTAKRILELDNWPVDVAVLSKLFDEKDAEAYAKKAVKHARVHCVSVSQFVAIARTLLSIFPDNSDVRDWIVSGSQELVRPNAGLMAPVALSLLDVLVEHQIEMGDEWWTNFVYGPISSDAQHMSLQMSATFFQHLLSRGVPCTFKDAVEFLLKQACDRHRSIAELTPVMVGAARLQCVPLDSFLADRVLEQENLTEQERAAINAADKFTPEVKINIAVGKPGKGSGGGNQHRNQHRHHHGQRQGQGQAMDEPPRMDRGAPRSHRMPMSIVKGGGTRIANEKVAEATAQGTQITEGFEMDDAAAGVPMDTPVVADAAGTLEDAVPLEKVSSKLEEPANPATMSEITTEKVADVLAKKNGEEEKEGVDENKVEEENDDETETEAEDEDEPEEEEAPAKKSKPSKKSDSRGNEKKGASTKKPAAKPAAKAKKPAAAAKKPAKPAAKKPVAKKPAAKKGKGKK